MGLLPTFCRALILLHRKVGLTGPVLTLGNQDVWADHDQLKSFFREMDCPYKDTEVIPHTSRLLAQRPEAKNFVHAKTLFGLMGITHYYDIDKFEIDSPSIVHDLNIPVSSDLRERFNLIVDSGTIEHIFDVRQVMENVIAMCRQSGWVVHVTPSSNWVDHGFYSFSPCFFYDFYQANGFGDFLCYVLQLNPNNFYERSPYFEYSYGMDVTGLLEPARKMMVFFAARKLTPSAALVIPTQGVYDAKSASRDNGQTGVVNSTSPTVSITESVVPNSLLPYLRPVRPALAAVRNTFTSLGRKSSSSHRRLRRI